MECDRDGAHHGAYAPCACAFSWMIWFRCSQDHREPHSETDAPHVRESADHHNHVDDAHGCACPCDSFSCDGAPCCQSHQSLETWTSCDSILDSIQQGPQSKEKKH